MKSLASARRKPIWPRLGLTIPAVCLCGRETAAGGTLTFRTVALRGDPAPGTGDNCGGLDFVIINAQGQTALIALVVGKPLVTQDFTWPRFTFRREVERAIGPAVLRAHRFVAEHHCVC